MYSIACESKRIRHTIEQRIATMSFFSISIEMNPPSPLLKRQGDYTCEFDLLTLIGSLKTSSQPLSRIQTDPYHRNYTSRKKRKRKVLQMERFIFCCFKDLVRASSCAAAVNGVLLILCISVIIKYQLEESAVLCFKGRDGFMNSVTYKLLSCIPPSVGSTPSIVWYYDEEHSMYRQKKSLRSIRNINIQLTST